MGATAAGAYIPRLPGADGKRRVPAIISTAPRRRDDTGADPERRRLVIPVTVTASDGTERTERALIDSGAEENCVRQTLAVECGWRPQGGQERGLSTLEGREIWTYGTHNLEVKATDSAGEARADRHRFVACAFEGLDVNIILGYPWLAKTDPTIRYRGGTWQFLKSRGGVEEVGPEEFYEAVRQEGGIYCVLSYRGPERRRIGAITTERATDAGDPPTTRLPPHYQPYADVFDAEKAGLLPKHHPIEHKIELNVPGLHQLGPNRTRRRHLRGIPRRYTHLLRGTDPPPGRSGGSPKPLTHASTIRQPQEGISMDPARVVTVQEWPTPRSIKDTQVETDASGYAVSRILSQLFGEGLEGRWHPVAFFSRKLLLVELRYDTYDKELMAIVLAMNHWGQYLRGVLQPVRVRTDHNNLRYFMTKRSLNGRQARWAESLARYDFYIEYRPGKANPADGPSRRPDYRPEGGDADKHHLPGLHFRLCSGPVEDEPQASRREPAAKPSVRAITRGATRELATTGAAAPLTAEGTVCHGVDGGPQA
ncbi:hypothetical protein V498_00155 [Pseudogymnoascus sp. VKM F-4517 (FW-2822)]|nr:hypothetical protein V498_00155 [Pseudogymnoascus sp. VKM F-4517 (FW-2822)]